MASIPPPPPPPPSGPPTGSTNVGVAPNVGGLLCYAPCCVGLIFSIVVAIVEKQSRFLRFHGFQSLLLHAVAIVVLLACQIILFVVGTVSAAVAALLGFLFNIVVGLGLLVATIMMMIKAYNGEEYELPQIGRMARNWV